MSWWCDNKLTITGQDRKAVLNAVKRETVVDGQLLTVFFSLEALRKAAEEKGVPTPDPSLPVEESYWISVLITTQHHEATDNSDILRFEMQWIEPVVAVRVLSLMFPENTFELQTWCDELVDWQDEEIVDPNESQVCHSVFKNGHETKVPKQAGGQVIRQTIGEVTAVHLLR